MLEALLKHFRSYGIQDLEFFIVNSKLSHSRDKLDELKKRVSFDVYQETDEEEVWSVMEGGKDDMYVYDRCGRLTYYIPFPLSILNESPLVSNAILATYFRSPCGVNCDQNKTLEIEDFVKNIEEDYDSINVTEQNNSTYAETDQPLFNNQTTDEQFSNDVLYINTPETNETDNFNSNNTHNFTDYDYTVFDNSLQVNDTNTTNVEEAKSFFKSIYELFFNESRETDNVRNLNGTSFDENNLHEAHNDTGITNAHVHQHMNYKHHAHHEHNHESNHEHKSSTQEQKKSNRCLEADYEVCNGWSKKRLLHAQKCCSEIHTNPEHHRSCHNFGKKRCKKMQPILKCCIKTVYKERATTVSADEESTTFPSEYTTPKATEVLTTQIVKEHSTANDVLGVVCCKTVDNDKLCRVSYAGTCEGGEYRESSPNEVN